MKLSKIKRIAFIGIPFLQERQSNLLNYLSKYFEVYALVPYWDEKLKYKGTPKEILVSQEKAKFKIIFHKAIFIQNRILVFYPSVIFTLRKIMPDVMVLNGYHSISGIILALYSIIVKKPLLVISAFNPTIPYNKIIRLILRFLYLIPKYIIVLTEKMKEKCINELKINPNKILVIPESGYELNLKKQNIYDNSIKILYTGRHAYEKGLIYLFFAFKKLIDAKLNVRLILTGEGPLTIILKEMTKKFNLEDKIEFKGYIYFEKLSKLYSACDIFVYPSIKIKNWEEQFGYSVIEAMCHGLAVVVTDCGSLPYVVKDAGIIVRQRNIEELADSLMKLICNRELLEYYKRKSIERGKDFSIDKIANEWKLLIEASMK